MKGTNRGKFAGALVALALLAGCSGKPAATATTTATQDRTATVVVSASVVGTPIATMLITVSANDIAVPLAFNLLIEGGYATGTLRIPPGLMRTFTASAFDSAGNVTHEGLVTVDVQPGQNPPLAIVLVPRPGQVPVTIYVGQVTIQVSPPEAVAPVGGVVYFEALVRDTNGAIVNSEVQWASFNPGIVSVSPASGVATCLFPGTAKVAAVASGVAGDATVVCSGGACDTDPNLGQPCGPSVGTCQPGYWACAGDGLVCTGAIGPSSEICDGLDNDCDGIVDNGCSGSICGDGVVQPGEECDDNNQWDGDGCSAACMIEPGWQCEPSNPSMCYPAESVCGNGIVEWAEPCDDGGITPGDGCSETCQVEPGWSCSGAPSFCKLAICGDGVVDMGESCDDGGTAAGDGCDAACQIEPGWTCGGAPTTCRPVVCGDGMIDADETCDDGGTTAGDGCSASCQVEPGWICSGAPSSCSTGPYRHSVPLDGSVSDYTGGETFPSPAIGVSTFVTWDDSFIYLALQQPSMIMILYPEQWWDIYVDFQGGGAFETDQNLYPWLNTPISFASGFQPDVMVSVDLAAGQAYSYAFMGSGWAPLNVINDVIVNPGAGVVEVAFPRGGPIGSTAGMTSFVVRSPYDPQPQFGMGLYPDTIAEGPFPSSINSWLQADFNSTLPPASPLNKRPFAMPPIRR